MSQASQNSGDQPGALDFLTGTSFSSSTSGAGEITWATQEDENSLCLDLYLLTEAG